MISSHLLFIDCTMLWVVKCTDRTLTVLNVGDSRAVLCRGGEAVPLSDDHKPDRPDEKERIEAQLSDSIRSLFISP